MEEGSMLPRVWSRTIVLSPLLDRIRQWMEPGDTPIPLPDFHEISYGYWRPALDLYESVEEFVLQVDLPGMDPSAIRVQMEARLLTVAGSREESRETGAIGFPLRERRFGSFSRSIRLPPDAVGAGMRTSWDRGILTIRVPRGRRGGETERMYLPTS